MYFEDKEHKDFYNKKIGQVSRVDSYSNSLIYLLSSNKETRQYFDEIYDLQKNEINMECLKKPWQTGTSLSICRLAFNLYGNIVSDELDEVSYLYTISEIMKNVNICVAVEAIKIRF